MDGQGLLRGVGQAVEIVQDPEFQIAQLEVQVATTAQLQTKEQHAPPDQEAGGVHDHGGEAGVGEFLGPAVKARPEMADGLNENAAQG